MSGKNPPGKKPPRGRVRVRLGIGLGLESGGFFPGGVGVGVLELFCSYFIVYVITTTFSNSGDFLRILTWKNLCFTEFSTKIHWNKRLTASDVFHMFTKSLSLFKKNVIHQIHSKNEWLLLSVTFAAKLESKTLFLGVFILKPTERAQILLKNCTRDFQNTPPFERSACF